MLSQSANLIMAEDTRQDKRASFSAITEHNRNGMARTSTVASSKTGASKKLVIKNFKGTDADHLYVCYSSLTVSVLAISICSNTRVSNFHTVMCGSTEVFGLLTLSGWKGFLYNHKSSCSHSAPCFDFLEVPHQPLLGVPSEDCTSLKRRSSEIS